MSISTIDSFSGEHEFLSNFSPHSVMFLGEIWKTSEHAYQAAKTDDPLWKQKIMDSPTPGKAKRLGSKCPLIKGWDECKYWVMVGIITAKFQSQNMSNMLVKTDPFELIEGNNWGDIYWGKVDGKGENNLGKILMGVRELHIEDRKNWVVPM